MEPNVLKNDQNERACMISHNLCKGDFRQSDVNEWFISV